ncbi:hypothetical protein ACD591_21015 [Rufibacter glacialis]|uniref:Uncharacterized protein n=1 Tax=Rufibacter glacialis TaxID=1259555 RepID=A0A5M8Q322_9BACT|nr:hypothetical protein [Rufibacter glacialis]KAA6430295.1 hypothetical protein FOE74_21020 [Rufibacter glacialis]GGK88038.1 hypothetical protein GCM10011405_39790 [Rufibacter glacialis]
METIKTFSADTEEELWQQVAYDMAHQKELLQYSAQLTQAGQPIYFDIDIDLGGGFEGGISSTTFMAPVPSQVSLRFALHEQGFMDEVGKFFGMEDIELGFQDIDDAFIIKTNEPDTLKRLLADPVLHQLLLKHKSCEFRLQDDADETGPETVLTFSKDEAILDLADLREIYSMLYLILQKLR